ESDLKREFHPLTFPERIKSAYLSPNGKFVIALDSNRKYVMHTRISVLDVSETEPKIVDQFEYSPGPELSSDIRDLQVSPDGQLVTAVVIGLGVVLWDLNPETGKLSKRSTQFGQNSTAAAFSPDGKYVAISTGAAVELWDARTLKKIRGLGPPGSFLGRSALLF